METTTTPVNNLTLVPFSYYSKKAGEKDLSCSTCKNPLNEIERFEADNNALGFFYPGVLMSCDSCFSMHYVLEYTESIEGPVTIQW